MSDVDESAATPAPPAARPAGLFVRLAALFYDTLLLLSVLFLATLAVLPLSGGEAMNHNPFYQTYLLLVTFFYFGWHWVRSGQTLGMRAWRLRVTQADGSPLTWWHALARFLFAVPSLLLFGLGVFDLISLDTWFQRALFCLVMIALALLWLLLATSRESLHDRMAGTKVVREPKITSSKADS